MEEDYSLEADISDVRTIDESLADTLERIDRSGVKILFPKILKSTFWWPYLNFQEWDFFVLVQEVEWFIIFQDLSQR